MYPNEHPMCSRAQHRDRVQVVAKRNLRWSRDFHIDHHFQRSAHNGTQPRGPSKTARAAAFRVGVNSGSEGERRGCVKGVTLGMDIGNCPTPHIAVGHSNQLGVGAKRVSGKPCCIAMLLSLGH